MDITHMWDDHHIIIIITVIMIVIGAKNKRPTSWPNGRCWIRDPRLNGNLWRQTGGLETLYIPHTHSATIRTRIRIRLPLQLQLSLSLRRRWQRFVYLYFFKTFFFSFSFCQDHRWRSCGWGLREGCDSYADFVAQKEEEIVEIV